MRDKENVCGTCKYHKHIYAHVRTHVNEINIEDGWVCINDESENMACYTEYEDSCDEWEER